MGTELVQVALTRQEALVLFEWLSRENDADTPQLHFEDQAEQRALWNLEAALAKLLVEPFAPNYRQLVQEARDSLRDEEIG